MTVRDVIWPTNGLVVSRITPDGAAAVPDGETVLHENDTIVFECETDSADDTAKYLESLAGKQISDNENNT